MEMKKLYITPRIKTLAFSDDLMQTISGGTGPNPGEAESKPNNFFDSYDKVEESKSVWE